MSERISGKKKRREIRLAEKRQMKQQRRFDAKEEKGAARKSIDAQIANAPDSNNRLGN